MDEPVQTPSEQSMTRLMSGVVSDTQELIGQQFALLRHELAEDLRKAREAGLLLSIGLGALLLASVLLSFALVYLLQWAVQDMALWMCFGIVGLAFAVLGGGMTAAAIHTIRSAPMLEQSMRTFEETREWIANPK